MPGLIPTLTGPCFSRLEENHSRFLSFDDGSFLDGPDAFVEEETKILEGIKEQHDAIEVERKVGFMGSWSLL